MKTIANELNELAYKMTGVNPKARTDAQAIDFIEQHYNSESGDIKTYEINPMLDNYEDPSLVTITDTEAVSKLKEVYDLLKNGVIPIVSLYANYFTETLVKYRFYSNKMFLYFEHYMLKSNDGNTFQIMYMAPTPTPTIKYYDIPQISTSYAEPGTPETADITDTDIIAVLDEIKNDFESDENIVNKISCKIYYDENDSTNIANCLTAQVSGSYMHLTFMFLDTNKLFLLHIYHYNSGYSYGLYKL